MTASGASRILVIHPLLPTKKAAANTTRTPEEALSEAVRLVEAIQQQVVYAAIVTVNSPKPATLLGSGTVARLAEWVAVHQAQVVLLNTSVSPGQQRNLEIALKCKVLDRTSLILEIFGARARTHEGGLQVELAALEYQKSRLVRSWTHLERQRGGFGFMGGPGESQLEIDRRLIADRIAKIKRELESVKRTRQLHRDARTRAWLPVVALVGYTNAGKSTLFNQLTRSAVMAKDMLFATLDPTMRHVTLPLGRKIILSDTVGFIADLPTDLVAAFRATLEEVCHADVVLHVRDIASPSAAAQASDVYAILASLGVTRDGATPILEVWNKADLLSDMALMALTAQAEREGAVVVSALTERGFTTLAERLEKIFARQEVVWRLVIPSTNGQLVAWCYQHGQVVAREDTENSVTMQVRLAANAQAWLQSHHPEVVAALPTN